MYNSSCKPVVTSCTFTQNIAGSGGGMYNYFGGSTTQTPAVPTVTNCLFVENTATNGGGIANKSSLPTVTNCLFINLILCLTPVHKYGIC